MKFSSFALATALGLAGAVAVEHARVLDDNIPEAALSLIRPKLDSPLQLSTKSALFGVPEYKTKLIAPLKYLKDEEVAENSLGCQKYSEDLVNKYRNSASGKKVIFLVDRGSCHFVTKVRNAQEAGAAAVIIVDEVCECTHSSHDECKSNACAALEPYMADDGTGSDVDIPSVLIDLYDGSQLKKLITEGEEKDSDVVVSLEWKAPKPTEHVMWELWTSSDETTSFKDNFKEFAAILKDSTTFTPHYFIWDGEIWGCLDDDVCGNQCIGGGRYCNPDPDGSLADGYDGAAVVHENLRQACIWRDQIDFSKDGGAKWWDYVRIFREECHKPPTTKLDPTDKDQYRECSKKVHKEVGLDFGITERCTKMDGNTNTLLESELKSRTKGAGERGEIVQLPTVIVNNLVERGGVTTAAVLDTLCAAFAENATPDVCKCVQSTPNRHVNECLKEDANQCSSGGAYCSSTGKCVLDISDCPTGMSGSSVFFTIVAVLMIAGGVAAAYFHHTRRQMRQEMQTILADYMPLEEMNNNRASGDSGVGMI